MTTLTQTEASLDAQLAALTAHSEAIIAPHTIAFKGPVVESYRVGDIVWMWDHYNTATIVGPSRKVDRDWIVSTTDADGSVSTYSYKAAWLRPAAAPSVFTWT